MSLRKDAGLADRICAISRRGFTLIELMVSIMLLTTMVACVYATILSSMRSVATQPDVAMDLARQKMEQLYEAVRADWWFDTVNFSPLRVGGGALDSLKANYTDATITSDGIDYTRSYVVEEVNNTYAKQYRRVKVTVSWLD